MKSETNKYSIFIDSETIIKVQYDKRKLKKFIRKYEMDNFKFIPKSIQKIKIKLDMFDIKYISNMKYHKNNIKYSSVFNLKMDYVFYQRQQLNFNVSMSEITKNYNNIIIKFIFERVETG